MSSFNDRFTSAANQQSQGYLSGGYMGAAVYGSGGAGGIGYYSPMTHSYQNGVSIVSPGFVGESKIGIKQETKKKGIGTRIMNSLKKYIEEHKGTLYALGAIFLIDHFLLKGALRERITKIVTSVLDKIQKTLEGV